MFEAVDAYGGRSSLIDVSISLSLAFFIVVSATFLPISLSVFPPLPALSCPQKLSLRHLINS